MVRQLALRATARVARTRRGSCSPLARVLVRATLAVALQAVWARAIPTIPWRLWDQLCRVRDLSCSSPFQSDNAQRTYDTRCKSQQCL